MKFENDSWWDRDLYKYIEALSEDYCETKRIQEPEMEFEYNLDIEVDKIIEYVELEKIFKPEQNGCESKEEFLKLLVDGELLEAKCHFLDQCRWELNKKVSQLKLISTKKIDTECVKINLVYKEESHEDESIEDESYFKLEPDKSYELPFYSTEISKLTFEAKGELRNKSIIELLLNGEPIQSSIIIDNVVLYEWYIGGPYMIKDLQLKNTGNSRIYIRNLITE
ncbi:hypothetical protein [Oceanirhabdus sp. W0125-5]|uniref:hypothetical protein n=1 Tax=Oceanirhabdus sp. W0125-5 TaxID=2999116 RepID=UPI0022F2F7FF|nr:hypothetical protein [Oceanirhabdus sp. W0125-5]WBW96373.1 hypothetical protein OW730_22160 [Oceanirhabdus sp. W0125-5]